MSSFHTTVKSTPVDPEKLRFADGTKPAAPIDVVRVQVVSGPGPGPRRETKVVDRMEQK